MNWEQQIELRAAEIRAEVKPGLRIGRLTIMSSAERGPRGRATWLCRCDCGTEKPIVGDDLRKKGGTISCGCAKREALIARKFIHGHTVGRKATATFASWGEMKSRCLNRNNKGFGRYGGRGIVVCDRWVNSFDNFLADMGECPKGLTLDRIDNNGNYEPGNCRWATAFEQANNTSANRLIEMNGERKTLAQWCRHLGLNYGAISSRLNRGHWDQIRALTTPTKATRS